MVIGSVKNRLAELETTSEGETARLDEINHAPGRLSWPQMFGGTALVLLVGIGSWRAGQEMVTPATPDVDLTSQIDDLNQRLTAAEQQVAQRDAELSATREELRTANDALETATAEPPAPVPSGGPFEDCDDCPEIVALPAGTFLMGSLTNEEGRFSNEGPQHEVSVQPFAICTHEVTFDQWDACVAAGGCDHKPDDLGWGRGDRPVINVSWNDTQQYLGWLSEKTGRAYRLPSEAEWEYAARADSTTRYFWGDSVGENRANCDGCGSRWDNNQTAPAGSFEANDLGLFDMHGNVWEWVEDVYQGSYEGAPADGSAWLDNGPQRVLRGGSWDDSARDLRPARRSAWAPDLRYNDIDFRCAGVQEPAGG